jgi:hypothetical protein
MANPPPWPLDDDDRPSGSVRPLSQADLQAVASQEWCKRLGALVPW